MHCFSGSKEITKQCSWQSYSSYHIYRSANPSGSPNFPWYFFAWYCSAHIFFIQPISPLVQYVPSSKWPNPSFCIYMLEYSIGLPIPTTYTIHAKHPTGQNLKLMTSDNISHKHHTQLPNKQQARTIMTTLTTYPISLVWV